MVTCVKALSSSHLCYFVPVHNPLANFASFIDHISSNFRKNLADFNSNISEIKKIDFVASHFRTLLSI